MSTMGERIYQKRKEYGYTMEELGSRLGVNKTAVNKWEKGIVKNIKQSTIKAMADIFECSPVWLMGFDDEPITMDFGIETVEPNNKYISMYKELSQEDQETVNRVIESLYGRR